ncbi:MAG TPA: hypothetical protein VF791_22270 [Pyrinomonadaceae bacterium]
MSESVCLGRIARATRVVWRRVDEKSYVGPIDGRRTNCCLANAEAHQGMRSIQGVNKLKARLMIVEENRL